MLLGVDDLETLAANPRGKVRLHNAWLHRAGAVWGLGVTLKDNGELKVDPGLALDGAGRELRLDAASCVDFGRWYTEYQTLFRPPLTPDAAGVVEFSVHVVARFRACLARPVPAISEPCSDTLRDVAWSRAQETLELCLVPGPAPGREAPYPRLRLLFGLRAADGAVPEDGAILSRRAAILAGPAEARAGALLALFRELAARDTIALVPASDSDGVRTLFPVAEPADVVLAEVTGVRVRRRPDGTFAYDGTTPPTVRQEVRAAHVATATLQELLCGAAQGAAGKDAGGPRVRPGTFALAGRTITFETTLPLLPGSVVAGAFQASTFDAATGWTTLGVTPSVAGAVVTVQLDSDPVGVLRFIARGTGPTPLLGDVAGRLIPFAGRTGGAPGTADDGHDFVMMHERS
jgi:hypothetical protein